MSGVLLLLGFDLIFEIIGPSVSRWWNQPNSAELGLQIIVGILLLVSTDEAWSVPGTAKQSPPEKGRPNPTSEDIEKGRWVPAFKAQDAMLDEHMKKYKLQGVDWRPEMYKQLEDK